MQDTLETQYLPGLGNSGLGSSGLPGCDVVGCKPATAGVLLSGTWCLWVLDRARRYPFSGRTPLNPSDTGEWSHVMNGAASPLII